MLVGVQFGVIDASALRVSYTLERQGVGDEAFREKSLSARSTPTRCRLRVSPFLLGGCHGYAMPSSLCVPGETLGPSGPGSSVSLSFLKVLLGTDASILGVWWQRLWVFVI
jgi:hypothetical protein